MSNKPTPKELKYLTLLKKQVGVKPKRATYYELQDLTRTSSNRWVRPKPASQ